MNTNSKSKGAMLDNDEPDVAAWDLQPWDTGVSFDRFRNFFLAQEQPRSLVEAYRR